MRVNEVEITVVSDGCEGRFIQWSDQLSFWQAFDFENFRHTFSSPQVPLPNDLRVLRRAFGVPSELLPDEELLTTPPENLRILSRNSTIA